ncbi:MAG: 3-methyl-2-oxobutanoate hydroxymethyltransferase [Rhodospirillaceae bacterium]|jgi:3-methyl-2-oxobutanoate hydroxymethyltransferase|nr:3-methyl-2-oxobutanoate hydroxymethyltransferase [Rhodospirillaceae bacterium]MBT3626911.1 3-methyl-2-oxobutanoate hydroxymethyltransferase [Rhodospirillaceae bacterium]MBT3925809.1 3-methyl-2-oxobutanoate hydroxymethyltransferase [Rhodospirillaceae bacterium]MBT4426249.1 3-methyl-2-oxobutanoate hydroxymethyltransferase [Rhodospirillaceae bacterium]MBT5039836.1 3-methyl-2-oxobutanoate hydroxymethyltransferase [Rhodospirillaceae bacterium]
MSGYSSERRINIRDLAGMKGSRPIVSLTAYSAPMARTLDRHTDMILVGDSLGMVVYGMETTVGVTLDMMVAHGAAVVRATSRACVIVDLPFGTYQESPEAAFRAAARVMAETGCSGVKLEGGVEMAETVRFLSQRGIPVLGHIGLMPQSVNAAGGFGVQGKTDDGARRIRADASAIADAGAFAIVIENTVEALASSLTQELKVPTIGIGASPACDGQILVTEDIVGLGGDFMPRFAKRFAELGTALDSAVSEYAEAVRERSFPAAEHCFIPPAKGAGAKPRLAAVSPQAKGQRGA